MASDLYMTTDGVLNRKVIPVGPDGNPLGTAASPQVTQPDGVADGATTTAWAASTPKSTTGYGSALIEVTTYANPITVLGGIAGSTNTLAVRSMADTTGALTTTITATGLYTVPCAGSLSYTGASNVVNLMLKR